MKEKRLTVVGHLTELRTRLIIALVAAVLGIGVGWGLSGWLFEMIMAPAGELLATGVTEVFMIQFRLGVYAGLVLASPVILWQAIAYVLPALRPAERRLLWWLPVGALLFIAGVAFSYYVIVPFSYQFFVGFAEGKEQLTLLVQARDYLTFMLNMLWPFGVVFELPLLALVLGRLGLVTARLLRRVRKYVIFGIFVVAAFLTPPEPVSQVLMALPMVALYEISILLVSAVEKRGERDAQT